MTRYFKHSGAALAAPVFFLMSLPLLAVAQPSCPNDAVVTFRDEVAGVVTLNNAQVRNVVRGGNNDDRSVRINLGGTQDGQVQGNRLVVDTIGLDEFPTEASAVRPGFNRTVGRFFEVNYSNGQYVFTDRADLDVEVTFTVLGDEASSTLAGSLSRASFTPELRNLNVAWFGGSNSLRRLRGQVRFRYSDLQNLEQPGVHRANLTVCIEVNGAI